MTQISFFFMSLMVMISDMKKIKMDKLLIITKGYRINEQ